MKLRTTLAAALLAATVLGLAVGAASDVLASRALDALGSLAIGAAYLAVANGVLRGRAWARWLGFGVALSGTLLALIGGGVPLPGWLVLALHAPLPLLLARPDDAHPRTAVSLLLAGAALVPVLGLATQAVQGIALEGCEPSRWALLAGGVLGVAGTVALARERTWGLLTVGLAGACLLGAYLTIPAQACGCASSAASASSDLVAMGAIVLLAAALPYAGPVARFLRRR